MESIINTMDIDQLKWANGMLEKSNQVLSADNELLRVQNAALKAEVDRLSGMAKIYKVTIERLRVK